MKQCLARTEADARVAPGSARRCLSREQLQLHTSGSQVAIAPDARRRVLLGQRLLNGGACNQRYAAAARRTVSTSSWSVGL